MEEESGWNPPSLARVRLRLMVLWANAGRAFLEDRYRGDPEGPPFVRDLEAWVAEKLQQELTPGERERHERPFGTWTDKEIRDNGWDVEAGQPFLWTLGLIERMPPFDKQAGFAKTLDDFFDYPEPEAWRPELVLRPAAETEDKAMACETIYWRINAELSHPEPREYAKKLIGRAASLGHVTLAADGDLALSKGRPITALPKTGLQTLGSINRERLQGWNWLCGQEASWDEVTEDTIVSWLWDENWPP